MRKLFKRFPFNKVFVTLFISLYTLLPSVQAVGVLVDDYASEDVTVQTEVDVEQEVVEIDVSEDILDEGISDPEWIANVELEEEEVPEEVQELPSDFKDGVYTVFNVIEGKEYVYPDNDDLRIEFTRVTEDGNLVIKRVTLTEEEKLELNTSDDYGWDITSSMSNGSFSYDLTLPNVLGNDVEVKYSEDDVEYNSLENVVVNEDLIHIYGLDHFTTFVVVEPTGNPPLQSDCNAVYNPNTGCYDSIQAAINASSGGETIYVGAGTYSEGPISVNKPVTILGPNAGTPGNNSARIAEARIENSRITITVPATIDGVEIYQTNDSQDAILVQEAATVRNSIIRREGVNSGIIARGITTAVGTAGYVIENNLFTGDSSAGIWGSHKTWNSGIWLNGGQGVVSSNVFEICRTAMNIDDFNEHINIHGNTFRDSGTYIAFGGTTPTDGQYTISGNEFYIDWISPSLPSAIFNNSNVTETFRIDATNNTFGGIATEDLGLEQKFALEWRMYHRERAGKDGVIDYIENQQIVVNGLTTIQSAIDATRSGDSIHISPGTYEEQLKIQGKNITLDGGDSSTVLIHSPLVLETQYTTSAANKPIIYINNSNSTIKNVTVDGLGRGNGNYRIQGVAFYNAGGEVINTDIKNIKETPPTGNQHGVGIYALIDDEIGRTLNIENVNVTEYQKGGVVFHGEGLTANIKLSTIQGFGQIDFTAQNGIQYSGGATGTVENNVISDNYYTPASWAATGILVYNAGDNLKILNNEVTENGWGGIYIEGVRSDLEISSNFVHNNFGDGIALSGSLMENAKVYNNNIKDNDYGIWINDNVPNNIEIYNNTFNNIVNAEDVGSHFFDNGEIGNTWSDYTGLDLDGDGIGETEYVIDEDSIDRYPLTSNYLSVDVTEVKTSKGYYKEDDILKIDVEITNNGNIQLDPTKEKLVINIKDPNGSFISGSFREVSPLSLEAGESEVITFYTTEQVIPQTWLEGMYKIYTSVYSNRTTLGYLMGGQTSSTTFVVDNTRPTQPDITNSPNYSYTNTNWITIEWENGDDEGLYPSGIKGYMIRYVFTPADGGTVKEWNPPLNEIGNPKTHSGSYGHGEGTYEIFVKTVDNAGNESPESDSFTITYDVTPPGVELLSPKDNFYTNEGSFVQRWTSEDTDVALYKYRSCSNDPTEEECDEIYNTTRTSKSRTVNNDNIMFWWQVRAVDHAGNTGPWSEARRATMDSIAPTVEITSHTDDQFVAGVQTVTGTVEDLNLSHYWFVIHNSNGQRVAGPSTVNNSGPIATPSFEWNTLSVLDGIYTIKLEARDLANNKNDDSVHWLNVVVDNTSPTGSMSLVFYDNSEPTYSDNFVTNVNTPSVRVTAEDNLSGVKSIIITIGEYSMTEGGGYMGMEAEFTSIFGNPIPDGTYTIQAIIEDTTGNTTTLTQELLIDTQAPISTITSPSDGYITNQEIEIIGHTTDTNSVDYVVLSYADYNEDTCGTYSTLTTLNNPNKDGLPFNWSYDGWNLEDGIYCIKAQGTDLAGNEENTAEIKGIIYDTADPTVTLISLINGILQDIQADGGFSGIESIEIRILSIIDWTTYQQNMNLNSLVNNEPGTYTVEIKVTDKAGNITIQSTTFTIPAPTPTTAEEILGAIIAPFAPQPAQALGTGGYLLAHTTTEEETEVEVDDTEVEDVQEDDTEVRGTEDENDEEEEEGRPWWIYPLIILPLLLLFIILWKRRKDDEVPQY